MQKYNPDPEVKKVRYVASVLYLLVLAFLVGGSYIHQQNKQAEPSQMETDVDWNQPSL